MTTHTVPRNMRKVQKLFKGMTNRYIMVALLFVVLVAIGAINFFSLLEAIWYTKLIAIAVVFVIVIIWYLFFRTPRMLDRTFLFMGFYVLGYANKNQIMKYIDTDDKLNKVLPLTKFHKDGMIEFKNGFGWIYAFDSDIVSQDNFKTFNARAQNFLNSLTENVFFKIEIRIEPKYDMQALTLHTNDLINSEKDHGRLEHLKSIQEYAQLKEENDYEHKCYFYFGLDSIHDIEEARTKGEKIEDGLKTKMNELNITFNRITDRYTLFEFYRGEF